MKQNKVQGEPITTVVRWRPINKREIENQFENWVYLDTNKNIVYWTDLENTTSQSKIRAFSYDKVVDSNGTTEEIYDETVKPIVEAALQGVNGTVFAYGQTGSGKKFTMRGYRDADMAGIISLSADTIFDYIYSQCEAEYTIKVTNYELYWERLYDTSDPNFNEWQFRDALKWGKILENPQSASEIMDYCENWYRNSLIDTTRMGKRSSKTHNILIVSIDSFKKDEDQYFVHSSNLSFVILAGSERIERANSTGALFKEIMKMNLSLGVLGNI